MSLAQASTTAKLKCSTTPSRVVPRRDGTEDLWDKLDAKMAEREAKHALAKEVSRTSQPKGWLRQIFRGMGFGLR